MPSLHLDFAGTYPSQIERELAARLCHLPRAATRDATVFYSCALVFQRPSDAMARGAIACMRFCTTYMPT